MPNPCPSCLKAHTEFGMRAEAIQPLPPGAMAPLGLDGNYQCHDCAAAGTLVKLHKLSWDMARIAVANDRQEKLRLPGAKIGLEFVRPSKPGDLEKHHQWLREIGLELSGDELYVIS